VTRYQMRYRSPDERVWHACRGDGCRDPTGIETDGIAVVASLQGDENYKPSSATFFPGSFGSSA